MYYSDYFIVWFPYKLPRHLPRAKEANIDIYVGTYIYIKRNSWTKAQRRHEDGKHTRLLYFKVVGLRRGGDTSSGSPLSPRRSRWKAAFSDTRETRSSVFRSPSPTLHGAGNRPLGSSCGQGGWGADTAHTRPPASAARSLAEAGGRQPQGAGPRSLAGNGRARAWLFAHWVRRSECRRHVSAGLLRTRSGEWRCFRSWLPLAHVGPGQGRFQQHEGP